MTLSAPKKAHAEERVRIVVRRTSSGRYVKRYVFAAVPRVTK